LLVDAVAGAQALTTCTAWGSTISEAASLRRQMTALKVADRRRSALRVLSLGIGGLGLILCGLFAAAEATTTQHLDVRLAAALVFASMASVELLSGLGQALVTLEQLGAAASRLGLVADLVPPLADGTLEIEADAPLALVMHQVTLQYPMANHLALDQLTLSLPAGQKLALVGPSGSGKSSVLVALLGLWPLESGTVKINQRDLRDLDLGSVSGAVGRHLGVAALFSGTVRSNLLGAGADEAAMTSVLQSLGLVPAASFLDRLVGERGQRLSGGERQRVSLARALLTARAGLFLDEPDAHLDKETAALVAEAIRRSAAKVTTIVCSHRIPDDQPDVIVELRSGVRVPRPE
ncbi:MAG: ATP-binding cassette domain-containing protein, partial [Actinomycetota bacterium]